MIKPSSKEEEYFVAQEVERLKKLREEHLRTVQEQERAQMRELHYLHCAKCGQKMETTSLEGVEIEICPDCGGVYLDSGELAKIIEAQTHGRLSPVLSLARRLWSEK